MHDIIERNLEDYLDGAGSREVDAHLKECPDCLREVKAMQQLAGAFVSLRAETPMEPPLGFAARVMRGVREEQQRSFWSVFTRDAGFVRKAAFASLLVLAICGSYLATAPTDSMAAGDRTPEAVIASHNVSSPNPQQHLDGMLVTLANYHQ